MGRLSGFLELLKEPLKILSQNGKLIAITTAIYLILYSISLILFSLSIYPFILDLSLKIFALTSSRPGTQEFTELLVAIREDNGFFLGIEAAYMVLFFFIIIFAQTAVITIASCNYNGNNLSLKELFLKVSKTWTRPFVTLIWVQFLSLGYICFFILPFMVPTLILYDHPTILKTILIFLAILFFTLYIYLSVDWNLALVVSVVEDSYGFSALSKAKELVKGKRVHGFLLTLFFLLFAFTIAVVGPKVTSVMPTVVGFILTLLGVVISVFQFLAFTGFYYQCKNGMSKSGGLEYSKISHVDEYLP